MSAFRLKFPVADEMFHELPDASKLPLCRFHADIVRKFLEGMQLSDEHLCEHVCSH